MADKKINCLDCGYELKLPDNPEIGDVVLCENCGVEMEIINLEPLELDLLLVEK